MKMRKIAAIFKKQLKDTPKNKTVLIQFIMFPALTLIMQNVIEIDGMPANYFVMLFAVMYVGMAPLTSTAAIISEEKEKNTLRMLLMSNVRASEYLLGVGLYVFALCMLGAGVFAGIGGYKGMALVQFLLAMAVGIITSLLMGAAIGTWSRNQMSATSITVPVMMVFSFMPMLAAFNEKIETVARITYSQQVSSLLYAVGNSGVTVENVVVIAVNMAVVCILFTAAYKKSGLA